jgi:hypothetical protein
VQPCFVVEFLRCPIVADTQRLLAKVKECEFPDTLGRIGCMH